MKTATSRIAITWSLFLYWCGETVSGCYRLAISDANLSPLAELFKMDDIRHDCINWTIARTRNFHQIWHADV